VDKTLAAVALAALLALPGCAAAPSGDTIAAAGDTRADLVTLAATRLGEPALDVTVGIAKLQTPAAAAVARKRAQAAVAAAAYSRAPVAAGMLTTVTVRAGERVKRGQVVARFDDTMLRLGLSDAEAAYRRALATADTLHAGASDLRDKRADLRQTRGKLASAQSQLETTLSGLTTALPKLQAGVRQLQAMLSADTAALAADMKALASLPPGPAKDGLAKKVAFEKMKVAGEQAKLAQLEGRLAQAQAGLPKLKSALSQLRSGRAKLASGLSQMNDAIAQLEDASDVVRIAAGARDVGVELARLALSQAVVTSPADGVVVSAMAPGQVAMVGAPVVVVRPDGPTYVDVYLPPEEAVRVRSGDAADVVLDSVPGTLRGTVATVWPAQVFPPTGYPTKVVHMSGAVRVTVQLAEPALPRGVPCDVVIRPSKK
jgi:multidrug resistance efflux pump